MAPASQSGNEPDLSAEEEPSRGRALLGWGLLALALPLALLTLSTLTGLGLDQNLPSRTALVAAILALALPTLGLAGVLGGTLHAHGLALWSWCLLVMLAFPGYFPQRREPVTRIGLEYFSTPLGEAPRERTLEIGLGALSLFGPEAPRPLAAEPLTSTDTASEPPGDGAETDGGASGADRQSTRIPYLGEGQSIIIAAHVDGPDFGEPLQFVFDTGATLTTMTREALEHLDVPIEAEGPRVLLRTAGGEMDAHLVLLDAVWLENEAVEWVTVAICEACASATTDGLLGLNVSSHFRVSIDHEADEIELVPHGGRRNRRLDIQPWLELDSLLRRWDDGRLELTLDVTNRARHGIRSSVFEVKCRDESFSVRLGPIPAFGNTSQQVSLPRGSQCERFEIQPLAASWNSDRF